MWHLPTLSSTSSSLGTSPIATSTSSGSTSANHSQDLSSVSSTSVTSSETNMQSPPSVKDEFSSNNSYAAADYRQILILETWQFLLIMVRYLLILVISVLAYGQLTISQFGDFRIFLPLIPLIFYVKSILVILRP